MSYTIRLKIRELLNDHKMTQKELAKATGIRESTISDIVRETRTVMNYAHIEAIAKAFKIKSIEEIIDLKIDNEE